MFLLLSSLITGCATIVTGIPTPDNRCGGTSYTVIHVVEALSIVGIPGAFYDLVQRWNCNGEARREYLNTLPTDERRHQETIDAIRGSGIVLPPPSHGR